MVGAECSTCRKWGDGKIPVTVTFICINKRREERHIREGLWGAEGNEMERGSQEIPAQRVLSYFVLILELSESITWSRQTPLLTFLFVFHSCL